MRVVSARDVIDGAAPAQEMSQRRRMRICIVNIFKLLHPFGTLGLVTRELRQTAVQCRQARADDLSDS